MELVFKFMFTVNILMVDAALIVSNFRQSHFFEENMDYGVIKTEGDVLRLRCARECSRDKNCRRFKYDEDGVTSGQCLTYEDGQHCPQKDNGWLCSLKGNAFPQIDCSEGSLYGMESLGNKISSVQPEGATEPFEVLCDFRYGGLTTVQSRGIYASPVDFNRTINDYINGFGRPGYNHWLGVRRINLISKMSSTKCNIQIFEKMHIAKPTMITVTFTIKKMILNYVSSYSTQVNPECGDSLTTTENVNEAPFFTYDDDIEGCAAKMAAGWWHAASAMCSQRNLKARMKQHFIPIS